MKLPRAMRTRADPQPARPRPNARTATIRRMIERQVAEIGVAPTDQQLAAVLACSVERVRFHRRMIGV